MDWSADSRWLVVVSSQPGEGNLVWRLSWPQGNLEPVARGVDVSPTAVPAPDGSIFYLRDARGGRELVHWTNGTSVVVPNLGLVDEVVRVLPAEAGVYLHVRRSPEDAIVAYTDGKIGDLLQLPRAAAIWVAPDGKWAVARRGQDEEALRLSVTGPGVDIQLDPELAMPIVIGMSPTRDSVVYFPFFAADPIDEYRAIDFHGREKPIGVSRGDGPGPAAISDGGLFAAAGRFGTPEQSRLCVRAL